MHLQIYLGLHFFLIKYGIQLYKKCKEDRKCCFSQCDRDGRCQELLCQECLCLTCLFIVSFIGLCLLAAFTQGMVE